MLKFEVIESGYRADFEKAVEYCINNYKMKEFYMFPIKNKSPRYSGYVIYEVPEKEKHEPIKQDEASNDKAVVGFRLKED